MHQLTNIKSITSPNQCLAYWLIHCYLYYVAAQPIISDNDFDKLTEWLKQSWPFVTHRHKELVTLDDLNARTGFAIKYPLSVEGAAWQALRDHYAVELLKTLPHARVAKKLAQRLPVAILPPPSAPPKNDSLFSSW